MRFPAVAPALTLAVCAALAAVPARAEHRCADPATQEAFLVAALQSNLQVLGVACSDMGRYSQFVDRYRADLVQHGNVMTAWFKKRYGGRANVEAERYSTEMVNAVSTGNNTFGGDLCPRNTALFTEALLLRNGRDLPAFAAAKDVVPASIEVCPGERPVAAPQKAPAKK